MKFTHVSEAPTATKADVLAFAVFGELAKDHLFTTLDKVLGGHLTEAAAAEGFTAAPLQSLTVATGGKLPAKRIVVLGGGKRDHKPATLRDLAAVAHSCAERVRANHVVWVVPHAARGLRGVSLAIEGFRGNAYRFSRYLSGDESKKTSPVQSVGLMTDARGGKLKAAETREFAQELARGLATADSVDQARDWINEPAGTMTPSKLAAEAVAIGRRHKSIVTHVFGKKECERLKMGMFLAVGQGSAQEPKLIHMVYKPAKKAKKVIALIGKGVMFDSGGYSLKPSDSMFDMKVDMSGAAAVIAAMDALAKLGCDYEVHAVAACCENLVSGHAYKLGDILIAMDGTSVEINNTDAEGRLTLGDALTYTRQKIKPDEIFDFATLTGACMVALGPYTAGVMGDHEKLVESWLKAAEHTGEDMWRLPLNPRLKDQLRSPIADMRNTGERWGGAITAGLFLKHFVKDTPWVHVDIAGPASLSAARPSQPRGGTGFGVATIIEYLHG